MTSESRTAIADGPMTKIRKSFIRLEMRIETGWKRRPVDES